MSYEIKDIDMGGFEVVSISDGLGPIIDAMPTEVRQAYLRLGFRDGSFQKTTFDSNGSRLDVTLSFSGITGPGSERMSIGGLTSEVSRIKTELTELVRQGSLQNL